MKRTLRILWVILAIILAVYFSCCMTVSLQLNYVITSAMNNIPYNFTLKNVISDVDYNALCPAQPELEEGLNTVRYKYCTMPITFLFNKEAYFLYTYIVIDINTGEDVYGSHNAMPVIYLESIFPLRIDDVIDI